MVSACGRQRDAGARRAPMGDRAWDLRPRGGGTPWCRAPHFGIAGGGDEALYDCNKLGSVRAKKPLKCSWPSCPRSPTR